MISFSKKTLWKVFGTAATFAVGHLVRDATRAGWRAAKNEDPPLNPASPKTTWRDALMWTAFSSLLVGLGRLFARRGAASLFESKTGRRPR